MRLLTLRTQQRLESARERATSGSNRSFSLAASVWKGERGAPSAQSGALAWAERRMQRGGIERIIRPDVASAERERPAFLGAPAKSWRRQGCPFTRSAPARSVLCSLARPCPAIQPSSPSPVFQKQPKLRRSHPPTHPKWWRGAASSHLVLLASVGPIRPVVQLSLVFQIFPHGMRGR